MYPSRGARSTHRLREHRQGRRGGHGDPGRRHPRRPHRGHGRGRVRGRHRCPVRHGRQPHPGAARPGRASGSRHGSRGPRSGAVRPSAGSRPRRRSMAPASSRPVPLYALVQVDRLSLSMAEIGIIGILGAVAATLSCLAWGSMADRRGSVPVMRIGSALGLVSIVLVRRRALGHLPVDRRGHRGRRQCRHGHGPRLGHLGAGAPGGARRRGRGAQRADRRPRHVRAVRGRIVVQAGS